MATITAKQFDLHHTAPLIDFGALVRLALATILPLAAFGAVNLMGETINLQPHFFSPAGRPGEAGAAIHIILLATIGLALGLAMGTSRAVLPWGVALLVGMIGFPFLATSLDSLALALLMTSVLFLALATSLRVAAASRLGGWLMLPTLIWLGFAAALGLAVAAAWSPPFALITAQNPAPAAG